MTYNRIGGKIYNVKFNDKEKAAIDAEVGKQVVKAFREFEIENDAAVLQMLHQEFGFGKDRLFKAWKKMYADQQKLCDRYEFSRADGGWLSVKYLKEIGVDLEEWYQEEANANKDK